MDSEIAKIYGNRVRVRVCGLCWEDERLLMVKHNLDNRDFWAPPGGGVEFGQSVEEALIREYKEETNLDIRVGDFLFGCEYIQPPIHSIELFYAVEQLSGQVKKGNDPELQIIKSVLYLPYAEILEKPSELVHGIFRLTKNAADLRNLTGFYRI